MIEYPSSCQILPCPGIIVRSAFFVDVNEIRPVRFTC